MSKLLKSMLFVAVAGAALAACGGGGSETAPPPVVVVPPAAKLEDGFGINFGIDYRADPNTDAKDPVPGDIIPLDLTIDPVTI